MTPEARGDLEVARLKVTAMSGEARILDYPPPPTASLLCSALPSWEVWQLR